MRALLALALVLAACDTIADGTVDIFIAGEGDYGTVYVCDSPAVCPASQEWCWNGSEEELEESLTRMYRVSTSCHSISVTERAWPAIVGCAYGCPLEAGGCNAHCGCFCP